MEALYRFKTKKEFIEEFGKDLERNVPGCWNHCMNKYFGLSVNEYCKELPKEDHRRRSPPNYIWVSEDGFWVFTMAMVVPLTNAQYIIKPCDCLAGCEKCNHTGEITKILPDSQN